MRKTCIFTLMAMAVLPLSAKKLRSYGDRTESVFTETPIHFKPDTYNREGIKADENNIIHLADGRIILKKMQIPEYEKDMNILLDVSLRSNGDRWDKTGSLFILPNEAAINLLSVASGERKFPAIDSVRYEKLNGVVAGKDYVPTLELLRFMTPFGVGYYSNDTLKRKPIFVDGWAESVEWSQNITEYRSRLQGEVWIGAFIDSWTPEGYKISVKLTYDELGYKEALQPKTKITPILNTLPYIGSMSVPDIFARKPLEVPFEIPQGAKNVRLKYTVTGHGGHSGGDEFTPCENIIEVDNKEVYRFLPWRTDCATFRRYNPSTYVWRIDREEEYRDPDTKEMKKRMVNEPLGSSDLSRSNWCPGSDVVPETISLKDIKPGDHTLTIRIPKAEPAVGNKLNHWIVSAYLIWEE
ncbi:MAG: PNGase F N-terminal domain-containing protein [Bacteroidales bacterium]